MKKKFSYLATTLMLLSVALLQACPPMQNQNPVTSASPSVMESIKPSESPSPATNPAIAEKSAEPSVEPSAMPNVVSSTASTPVPVATPNIPVEKTYKYDFSLNSGKATAYITYTSATSGRLLVNFENIDIVPSKIALLDSYGNELILSNSFNVSKSGYVILNFTLKDGVTIYKIKLTINGIDYLVDATITNGIPTFTSIPSPVSPNPTPTPNLNPQATPTPYKQTFIDPCFNITSFNIKVLPSFPPSPTPTPFPSFKPTPPCGPRG